MPFYAYYCSANGKTVEVMHKIKERLKTWGELCALAEISIGDTPQDASVTRMLSAPQVRTPVGNTRLKELGFTKLVKRDKGVYENMTATGTEKRYMKADDPSSMPHIHKKIKD